MFKKLKHKFKGDSLTINGVDIPKIKITPPTPSADGKSKFTFNRSEGVRTVVLAKTKKGYGFVLRGAKGELLTLCLRKYMHVIKLNQVSLCNC